MDPKILEELPELPVDKYLLIYASDRVKGLNFIKSLLDQVDRGGKWTKLETSETYAGAVVSERVGLVITTYASNKSTVMKIRRESEKLKIPCMSKAYTTGEVKAILRHLHDRKKAKTTVVDMPQGKINGNGNGKHVEILAAAVATVMNEPVVAWDANCDLQVVNNNEPGNTGKVQEQVQADTRISDLLEEPCTASGSPVQAIIAKPVTISEPTSALDLVEDLSSNFGKYCMRIQDAVCNLTIERDNLAQQVDERDEQIDTLTTQVKSLNQELSELRGQGPSYAELQAENIKLKTEKGQLQNELERLQKILNSFTNLMSQLNQSKG
jgi:hypothetical protein